MWGNFSYSLRITLMEKLWISNRKNKKSCPWSGKRKAESGKQGPGRPRTATKIGKLKLNCRHRHGKQANRRPDWPDTKRGLPIQNELRLWFNECTFTSGERRIKLKSNKYAGNIPAARVSANDWGSTFARTKYSFIYFLFHLSSPLNLPGTRISAQVAQSHLVY